MSLFNSNATVAKVVEFFNTNESLNSDSRNYWTGIDMSIHNDQPFFKVWVAFCAISKMINDSYYASDTETYLPKRTPINFDYLKNNLLRIRVSMLVEADNVSEVSSSSYNGYLMSNMSSQFSRSSYSQYYSAQTPYLASSSPRPDDPLQQIWDSARVLNSLAKGTGGNRELPDNGGLNIRLGETSDSTKMRLSIKAEVPLASSMLAFYSTLKNSSS